MIDPRVLRDQPDRVRAAQAKRGLSDAVVDEALAADARRRQAIADFEAKRGEQKSLGKQIPQAQGEERQALLERTKTLAAEVKAAEAAQTEAEEAWQAAILSIPNLAHDDAPAGGEDDYTVLETVGTPRDFAAEGFEPRDHVELGRMLGAIDIERGAKVSGSRFYFLTGVGAQLELALVNLAMEQARNAGFTQVIAPSLVRPRAMEGTGFLGQAADDVYRIEGEDLYLVGTSEVPMAAYHSDEILDVASLPLRYAAFSPCFRKEAGSHGKDTKGIIRVHWFDKVEMFVYTTIDESDAEHQRLLAWEKEFLDKLELSYRVIDTAAGDLGLSASGSSTARPGSRPRAATASSPRPPTAPSSRPGDSTSAAGPPTGTGPIATLNGTLCAIPRTIVAILETHQNADGSVTVPQALRPFMGGLEVLKPVHD